MKEWIGMLVAMALLAGCVTQQTESHNRDGWDNRSSNTTASTDNENRQRARTFTDLAGAYYARAQYKTALDELRKAITIDNQFGPAFHIYGLIYMELAEDKLAEENFRRAIDLDQNDSDARNNLGWFLCTRGRYNEGLDQFSAAIRNPLYARPEHALSNAGLCAEKKGDLALAEANLTKAFKLQPDNAGTVLRMAGLTFRQNRLMETRRWLSRYTELAQPTAESLWLNVRLERKSGDRAQEATYGLQLRKRFPDSNEVRQLQAGQYE